jgi:hypothetical protein
MLKQVQHDGDPFNRRDQPSFRANPFEDGAAAIVFFTSFFGLRASLLLFF